MGVHGSRALVYPGTASLLDLEVPGLVPDANGIKLSAKRAQRQRYHGQRQRRQVAKWSREERSRVDRDRCLEVIEKAVDENRRKLD